MEIVPNPIDKATSLSLSVNKPLMKTEVLSYQWECMGACESSGGTEAFMLRRHSKFPESYD